VLKRPERHRRRRDEHLPDARVGRGLEHVVGAVHVHVVHEALVVDRVEDEREVDQHVGVRPLERRVHGAAVAHVHALVLGLRPVAAPRRRDVRYDDLLGVLAAGEQLDETRADVARAAGDQVAHGAASYVAAKSTGTTPDPAALRPPDSV
jgi:hypothetical protein